VKRVLKWVDIVLGGLLGVIVVAAVVGYFLGGSKLNDTFEVPAVTLAVPTDAASIERGRHLVETIGMCQECHGDNLAGEILD
jgi:mono/diheme cytochrome c family protein